MIRVGPTSVPRRAVEALHLDAGEGVAPGPPVGAHRQHPGRAVVVVEERRVEAVPVQADRIGPRPVDGLGGDDVVLRIPVAAREAAHVGVDEVEAPVDVRQVGRPHAAGVADSGQVEEPPLGDGAAQRAPVHQVARVVQAHARIPLEGRRGEVVVLAHAEDRGVGVEARQHRVADRSRPRVVGHGFLSRLLAEPGRQPRRRWRPPKPYSAGRAGGAPLARPRAARRPGPTDPRVCSRGWSFWHRTGATHPSLTCWRWGRRRGRTSRRYRQTLD